MKIKTRKPAALVPLLFLMLFLLAIPDRAIGLTHRSPDTASAASTVLIIDDGCPGADPPGFERRAPPAQDAWICISAQNTVYWARGGDALYVRTNASPVEWVKWRPTIPTAGQYKVEVSIPNYHSNASKTRRARYTIHHAGGSTVKIVNQEATAGTWVSLGTYNFGAGTGGYVHLQSYTTESPLRLLAADAVRFTRISTPPPPTPTPPPPQNHLSVPYADQVYVQQSPECYGTRCYFNHCGPASIAMVLSYYKKVGDVLYDRRPTLDLVGQVKPGGKGGASRSLMERALQTKGLNTSTRWAPSFAQIKQSIQNGHPIVLSIDQANHILVVVGYEGSDTLIVNDPMGGKSWWDNIDQRNDRKSGSWITRPPTPQLKGRGVKYRYSAELSAQRSYAIFVTGPVPRPQGTQAVMLVGQTASLAAPQWLSQTVEAIFPPWEGDVSSSGAAGTQDISTSLTVTYTPKLVPAQPAEGIGFPLASFRLDAVQSSGQSVDHFGRPFALVVDLDPTILAGLDDINGSTLTQDQSAVAPTAGPPAGRWTLVLAYRDDSQGRWVPIPSTADPENGQIIAESARFAEYAVFAQYRYQLYLPFVTSGS